MPRPAKFPVRSAYPLLSSFFAFWEDVEDLRRHLEPGGAGDERFPPVAAGGRERLAEALRRQRLSLTHAEGAIPSLELEEAQYVMAATADELFIGLRWDGAEAWTMRPLEVELFGTRRAGEEVFARIDRLTNGFGPVHTEMASVYLTALELGFKGKFADDRASLDGYESRLRDLVGRRPLTVGPLVPDCYDHTTVAGSAPRLAASRLWWSVAVAIAGVAVLALVITLMRFRSSTIEDARQRLETSFGRMAVWQ